MRRVLVISRNGTRLLGLEDALARCGLASSFTAYGADIGKSIAASRPDVVLCEIDGHLPAAVTAIQSAKKEGLPVIALVPSALLDDRSSYLEADDFIVSPYEPRELMARVERLIGGANGRGGGIRCRGLVIDPVSCEVTVDGRPVALTFKEYELLKLLAANPGRVFTRQALLDRVWGEDYYGGDRTVDVHVRRLRAKIEEGSHTYIETVRNIGYRFVKNA